MNTTICRAIADRCVIKIRYGGGTRLIEPHCHGISIAGNEVLRGYQASGYSSSGNRAGWKMFRIAEIRALQITMDTFSQDRPQYNADDEGMRRVHCHV